VTDPGLPPEAVTAAAVYLHDEDCDDGDTQTCGRWRCGSDPQSRHHSLHARHVEYYRSKAAAILAAGAPAIRKAERERIADMAPSWRCPCGGGDCAAADGVRDFVTWLLEDGND
jgi:hypothetical protein